MKEKIKQIVTNNIEYLIAFILLIIIIRITIPVFKKEILDIDISFYHFVVHHIRNKYLTYFMRFITALGGSKIIILLTITLLITVKNKTIALFITINPILISIINLTLKSIVARARPTEFFLIIEKGFSFPSGHAMVSTAFYGLLIYLVYKYIDNKRKKVFLITILSLLIPLIMFSRVYLGVHYLSDITVGCLLSIVYLIIYIKIMNKTLQKTTNIKRFQYLYKIL